MLADDLEELLAATEEPVQQEKLQPLLGDDDPVEALKLATALPRGGGACKRCVLIARCHVAMGSLTAAARAYEESRSDEGMAELRQLKEWAFFGDYMWHLMRLFFPRHAPKQVADPRSGQFWYDGEFAVPDCPGLDEGEMSSFASTTHVSIGYRIYSPPPAPPPAPPPTQAEPEPPEAMRLLGPRRTPRGVILFFHGNAEVASDYVQIAPLFNWLGFHLMVVDYRGCARSSSPAPMGRPAGARAQPHADRTRPHIHAHTHTPSHAQTAHAHIHAHAQPHTDRPRAHIHARTHFQITLSRSACCARAAH